MCIDITAGLKEKAAWADLPFPVSSLLPYFEIEMTTAAGWCGFSEDWFSRCRYGKVDNLFPSQSFILNC